MIDFKAHVIFIPNPLSDVRLLRQIRSIPTEYMDENEVLQLLLGGVATQILEDPDQDFPFNTGEYYDAMLRDILSSLLTRTPQDPDAVNDTVLDWCVDVLTKLHEDVLYRIMNLYPSVCRSVYASTHTFTITTVRGSGLWELEGEDEDIQVVFLRTPTYNIGTHYGRSDYHHPQRAG